MATVFGAQGTDIQIVISGTGTSIPGVESCGGLSMSYGNDKTTGLLSNNQTYRSTVLDPGDFSFTIQWDPTNVVHTYLQTLFLTTPNQPNSTFYVKFPSVANTTKYTLTGFIEEWQPNGMDDLEKHLLIDIKIKLATLPTFTA